MVDRGDAAAGPSRAAAIRALIRRDWLTILTYSRLFALDVVFGALNLVTYYFISRTFVTVPPGGLGGAPSYFAFAAVGVAILGVVQAAMATLSIAIREEQMTGTLEALIMQPLGSTELALGLAGYHFLFAVARSGLYLLIAVALLGADASHADWVGFVLSLFATAAALTAIGIALGALVLMFQRVQALLTAVMFVMGLLGGAFFPIAVLPGWLEGIAKVIPTRLAFESVRNALYRGDAWVRPAAGLAAFALVGVPLAIAFFGFALRTTKRRGTVAEY